MAWCPASREYGHCGVAYERAPEGEQHINILSYLRLHFPELALVLVAVGRAILALPVVFAIEPLPLVVIAARKDKLAVPRALAARPPADVVRPRIVTDLAVAVAQPVDTGGQEQNMCKDQPEIKEEMAMILMKLSLMKPSQSVVLSHVPLFVRFVPLVIAACRF